MGDDLLCQKAILHPLKSLRNPQDFYVFKNVYDANVSNCKIIKHFNILSIQRKKIRQALSKLPDDKSFNIIKSLIIGGAKELTRSQYLVLQKTGTLHLIAVSGLHIGLLITWCRLLFRALLARFLFAFLFGGVVVDVLSMLVAYDYALLIHLPVSAQRSLIMCFVAVIMQWFGWCRSRLLPLYATFYIMLMLNPKVFFQPGFWLSCLGVLLVIFGGFSQHSLRASVVVFLGTSIVCAYFFNTFTWIGVVANMIAIPVFSIWIVPLSILGVVIVSVSQNVANMLWVLSSLGFEIISPVLFFFSGLVNVKVMHVSFVHYFISFLGVLGFVFFTSWSFLFWVVHLFCFSKFFEGFIVTVLDVGQGLSVVVETKEHVLVYDTGLKYKDYDVGQRVISPFLNYKGISLIDNLIVSHGDVDHSGGAKYLVDNFIVKRVLSSEPNRLRFAADYCYAGQHWVWDGVVFSMLSPPVDSKWRGNKGSCVLMVDYKGKRLILPGDVDVEVERWLVKNYNLRSDVLIVPHHGSKTSSSKVFLDAVSPKSAIISSGFKNRFNLPNTSVVKSYLNKGVKLLNTQDEGAIVTYFR